MITSFTLTKEKFKNLLYLFSFALFIIWGVLRTSMFSYTMSQFSLRLLLLVSMIGFTLKILFFESYNRSEIIIILFWMVMILLIAKYTHYLEVIYYSAPIFASRGIKGKKIMEIFFTVGTISLVGVILASKLGYIPDLVTFQNGVFRHSLGTMYATNLSAKVFFLVLAYCYIKNLDLSVIDYILILLVTGYIYKKTYGKLDTISILLVLLVSLLFKFNKLNWLKKLIGGVAVIAPAVCFFISYYSARIYSSLDTMLYKINQLMTNRLMLSHEALKDYHILTPFGQKIYTRGNGGLAGLYGSVNKYFYIDSSYLAIALKYGIILLVLLLILLTVKGLNSYLQHNWVLSMVILIMCINAMVADFLFVPIVNPFILLLFADTAVEKNPSKIEVTTGLLKGNYDNETSNYLWHV